MQYKIWTNKVLYDEHFTVAELENADTLKNIKILGSSSIASFWPDVHILIDEKSSLNNAFRCGPMNIVDNYIKEILIKHSCDVELLPVKVSHRGLIYDNYYYAHVMRFEDVLDRELSIYEDDSGEIGYIEKIKIDESKVMSRLFFIDSDELILVAHVDIERDILDSELTGLRFIFEGDWKPY